MTTINKKLYKFTIIILGMLMLLSFIWLRFIRPRLPREIPFSLSLVSFVIIIYVCVIYLYIIISLFRGPTSSNPLLKDIINYIFIPLETLDHYLKDLSSIKKTYKHFMVLLASKLNYNLIPKLYYVFEIFPRIILVTVLFTDIFGHHELNYIYKFLLFGAVILLGKYIKYSFKYAKEHFIESFQDKLHIIMAFKYAIQIISFTEEEDDDIPETMVVPLKEFIEFQTTTFIQQLNYHPYITVQTRCDDSYYIKRNLLLPKEYSAEEIKTRVKNILQISVLLAYYNKVNAENSNIKKLRILIYLNYLICWLYILLISFPSLFYASFEELWIIFSIQESEEPFSGIIRTFENL